jgi:hypothetical protein
VVDISNLEQRISNRSASKSIDIAASFGEGSPNCAWTRQAIGKVDVLTDFGELGSEFIDGSARSTYDCHLIGL